MPSKNKPKRLDRVRSWRVARRKRKRKELVNGNSRSRKKREKTKIVSNKIKTGFKGLESSLKKK